MVTMIFRISHKHLAQSVAAASSVVGWPMQARSEPLNGRAVDVPRREQAASLLLGEEGKGEPKGLEPKG